MNYHRYILAFVSMFIFIACGVWPGQAAGQVNVDVGGLHIQVGDYEQQEPPQPAEIVVLTRGPIHEAFAQPVTFDERAGFIITRRPPAPFLENVPYEKPRGDHIVWIPGYWSWDSDRNDFIWISGCWRAVPPHASWVPGYWAESRRGYQWIAGFWTTADTDEIEYLPAPPDSLEEGPFGRQGSDDNIWIPGCWVRHNDRYAWRSGFWAQPRRDWVWVPAQYIYTPRGYVYVKGYWDYSLDRRGVAFLPVYCPPSVYGQRNFQYSPQIALDLDDLMLNLFISRDRHHYYFGDYYGDNYVREGYRPWYESRDHHDWYDPIFVHERWRHRDDRQWGERQRTEYEQRRTHKEMRPARTYRDMKTQAARMPEKDRRRTQFARPITEVVAEKRTPFKFERLDDNRRRDTTNREREVRDYQDKRSKWESRSVNASPPQRQEATPKKSTWINNNSQKQSSNQSAPVRDSHQPSPRATVFERKSAVREDQPQRVRIPRSPIVDRRSSRDRELTPPPQPRQPEPNPDVKSLHKKSAKDRSRDEEQTKDKKPKSKRK